MPQMIKEEVKLPSIQVYSGDAIINPGTLPPRSIQQHVKKHWTFVPEWIVCVPKNPLDGSHELTFYVLKSIRDRYKAYLSETMGHYVITLPVQGTK